MAVLFLLLLLDFQHADNPPTCLSTISPHYRSSDIHIADGLLLVELAAGLVFVVTPHARYCPEWLLDRYELAREGLVYRVTGRELNEHASDGEGGLP